MKAVLLLLLCLLPCVVMAQRAVVLNTLDVPRVPSCVAIDADLLRPRPCPQVNKQGIVPLSLRGRQSKFWSQHATLRMRFLDGTRDQQAKAWAQLEKVDALVNLTFVRVTSGESECRVSFRGEGHWSYLGRDCLTLRQDQPTMNLQLTSRDSAAEWSRVVLHEGMHFIGFGHELQHPHVAFPWNVPVVLADYRRTQGWSEAMTRRQVLNRDSPADFAGSEFDKDSIQAYPVPARHVTDARYAVGFNSRFSVQDIATAKRVYPPVGAPSAGAP